MKTKLKPLLILLATLIIGFVLGGLTTVHIIRYKVKNFATEEGFKNKVYDFIDPDNEQKVKLEPIINKYAKQFVTIKNTFLTQFLDMVDSIAVEIDPLLNESQKEKSQYHIGKLDERFEDIIEQNK